MCEVSRDGNAPAINLTTDGQKRGDQGYMVAKLS
jgi:hypothetical protein